MKLEYLVKQAAIYLDDYDHQEESDRFVTWTEEQLRYYGSLTLSILALTAPEKYTRRVEVPLVAGAEQEIPDSCKEFKRVSNVTLNNGTKSYGSRVDLSYAKTIDLPICEATTTSDTYKLLNWDFDPQDKNVVFVDPPVPEGTKGTLYLQCFNPPSVEDFYAGAEIDVPPGAEVAVFELMLYYAMGVEYESPSMRNAAEYHWGKAMAILQTYAVATNNIARSQQLAQNGSQNSN